MDIGYNNAGAFIKATEITSEGFTLEVTAPQHSVVYFLEATWFATTNPNVEVLREESSEITEPEYSSAVKVNNDDITEP